MKPQPQNISWPELTAILLMRLGFLWLLVFISLLLPNDDVAFYALMGIAFIITIPYSLWLRSKVRTSQFAPLQFVVDLVLVTGLVYFTGGVHSDLALLYPLVILSSGIVGSPRQAAEITVLGILGYVLMATLLQQGLVVEYMPAEDALNTGSVGSAVLLRVLTFACFGAASIYVAKRCNYINTHERDLEGTTTSLLHGIPSPTLLLDAKGKVVFANDPACDLLEMTNEHLCTQAFSELCVEGPRPIPEKHGRTTHLATGNGKPLPAAYLVNDIVLPGTTLQGTGSDNSERIQATLVGLTDISRILEIERQLEKVERITAATHIAGELAHEIRTPLTALSASIQLLRHYEEKATASDWLPNSPRRQDRRELFSHIEDASRQMDSVIQNFVDFAEFSPADLLSIIKLDSPKENQGYIGHLNTIGRGLKDGENTESGRRSDNPEFIE